MNSDEVASTYNVRAAGQSMADGGSVGAERQCSDTSDSSDVEYQKLDLEKPSETEKEMHRLEDSGQIYLVNWEHENNGANPKNWSKKAKWVVTLTYSAYDFVTLISSSMIAPALPAISRDLDIQSEIETQVVFSAFILAGVIGPLIFCPLSERYGRKIVVEGANAVFLIWTIVCGFANSKLLMVFGRVISGFGASVVFGVTSGAAADCWKEEERGLSLAILNFAPLCAPALGPIVGGYLTESLNWRWIFWVIAMLDGALELFAALFLKESYGPVILERKAKALRKSTGNDKWRAVHEFKHPNTASSFGHDFAKPFIILATHPCALILSVYSAANFGVLYIVLSTFASLWADRYHQSVSSSGLHYISLVIGFVVGCQACSMATDYLYRKTPDDYKPEPEIRVKLMVPGSIFWIVGLLIYGWGAEKLAPWIVPDIGAAVFGIGSLFCTISICAYLTDVYGELTASAMAGMNALRSLFAFVFPLFAPKLYNSLGYGWGNTLLGFVCIGLGSAIPASVWIYGPKWRATAQRHRV